MNNPTDAEDLTQDVFYKLSRSNSSNIGSIKSWVYTIAKNTITDYYRKKKLITSDLEDIVYFEEPNDSDAVKEMSQCVGQFINQLPEDYRSIMTLSEFEGISQKEIAAQLNMNYVTVRSKIQRGRKKLKGLFSDCCAVIQGGKGSILEIQRKGDASEDDCCCG